MDMAKADTHTLVDAANLGRSVSIDRAAALLHVSKRTIYNRIREGRLQTIRTLGGSQRVLVSSILDLDLRPVQP
jgi:excisionase family DNA binding protein